MKKRLILVLLIASAIIIGACSFSNITIGQRSLRGSGDVITETRQVSNFTRIELDGSGDVEIVFGNKESITIEAEDNIMPLIETKGIKREAEHRLQIQHLRHHIQAHPLHRRDEITGRRTDRWVWECKYS